MNYDLRPKTTANAVKTERVCAALFWMATWGVFCVAYKLSLLRTSSPIFVLFLWCGVVACPVTAWHSFRGRLAKGILVGTVLAIASLIVLASLTPPLH